MLKDDVVSPLDRTHPNWWIDPPRCADFFDYMGRFALSDLNGRNPTEIDICKGKILKSRAGVYYFTAHSYTFDGTTETLDEPGAITGQLHWYPIINGSKAVKGTAVLPNNTGYIGAPTAGLGKQAGYIETFPPDRDFIKPPLVILSPSDNFGLRFILKNYENGKPIPEGGERFIQGRIVGWSIAIPPGNFPAK